MIKIQRCAIYIRVSTAEQQMHGKSLGAQRDYLLQYASDHQLKVIAVYADEGKTARKELRKRKAIYSLLESVKRREIDVILFWKMDRWFRNVADFYKVQDILDACQVKWIAVAEPNINMDTRDGRLNLNIMLSIGQNEVDTTSERIRFVNESSVRQGRVIFGNSSMPFGYKVAVVDGIKRMVKDKDKEMITADAFQYYLLHHSKKGTVKYINQKYGNIFSTNIMNNLCKNTMYYGHYRSNSSYCPPYITREEYDKIQEINAYNIAARTASPQNNIYLFTGLVKCPQCGRTMSSNTRKKEQKKGVKYYRYYRCLNHYANHNCSFSGSCGEEALEKSLLSCLLPSLQKYTLKTTAFHQQDPPIKKIDKEKLEQEILRLNLMFQKGRISEQWYNEEYTLLQDQLQSCTPPAAISSFSDNYALKKTLHNGWKSTYLLLSRERKRCFWRAILQGIEQDDEGKFCRFLFAP